MIGDTLHAIRVLGLRRLLRLGKAHRIVWKNTLQGYFTTRTMQTLLNVGFFDRMDSNGRVEVRQFAEEQDLDPQILEAMCNSLYAMRILDRENGAYRLSSDGAIMIEVGRGWFDGVFGYEEIYHELQDLLCKRKVYGRDFHRKADFVAKGSGEAESWVYFPLAIHEIVRSGHSKVLDLGCGDGTFLRHLCERTEVEGRGLDLAPAAIADAERLTTDAGLTERIQYIVGDITKLETVTPELRDVDLTITFLVLHEILWNGREQVIELLSSYRRLFPGVPFMIFEAIRPSDVALRRRPGMMVQYLLQHELSHQKMVSREEWRGIFADAGFTVTDEKYFDFARTAMFTIE